MRRLYGLAALLVCFAVPAHAGGINLAWNDCGAHGLVLKNFACNRNTGSDVLFASLVSPLPLSQVVGLEAIVDIVVDGQTISPWWDFTSTGCRRNRLAVNVDFALDPTDCVDPWLGYAVTALTYTNGVPVPNGIRVHEAQAVPPEMAVAVDDVTEYYAFKLVLSHASTVGTGSCSGCFGVAACIVLESMTLYQPIGVGDYTLVTPQDRQDAYWQCLGLRVTDGPRPCDPVCPVPARNRTWGGIKTLYR